MATTVLPIISLALNTASASNRDADATAATSTTDGWVLTLPTGIPLEKVVLKFVAVTNTDTIVIKAGTNPPAKEAGLGDLSVALTVNTQVKYVVIDPGRFTQSDGTIKAIPGQTSTLAQAYALPIGIIGGASF